MTRVLVTGATGFIGAEAVQQLIAAEWDVHAASRVPLTEAPAGVSQHAVDLLDRDAAARMMARVRPTHWLHAAWYTEPGLYWRSPENLRWLEASLALLRDFREAGGVRVVMAGTCAEYDWGGDGVCDEATPLTPTTLYGVAKNALRAVLDAYCAEVGLSWGWGRVFFLYGPAERPERLVPAVVRSLLAGAPALCTSGAQRRDFLHVHDVASGFVTLLKSDYCGAVNVASGQAVPVRDVITAIADKLGRPDLLRLGARALPPGEPAVLAGDARQLRALGWQPRFTLHEGLDDAIAWWRRQQGSRAG